MSRVTPPTRRSKGAKKKTLAERFLEQWRAADEREGRRASSTRDGSAQPPVTSESAVTSAAKDAPIGPGNPLPPETAAELAALRARLAPPPGSRADLVKRRAEYDERARAARPAVPDAGRAGLLALERVVLRTPATSDGVQRPTAARDVEQDLVTPPAARAKLGHDASSSSTRRDTARLTRAPLAPSEPRAPRSDRGDGRPGRPRRRRSDRGREWIEKVRAVVVDGVSSAEFSPKDWPAWVYALVHRILYAAPSSRTAERELRKRGALAARARLAAQGLARATPRRMESWRARVIATIFCVAHDLSRETQRRGYWRKLDGFSVAMWQSLIPTPHATRDGQKYGRSAFDATSWGADRAAPDDCGFLVALERAEAIETWAPPVDHADPRFVGPPRRCADGVVRRFPFVVMWFPLAEPP